MLQFWSPVLDFVKFTLLQALFFVPVKYCGKSYSMSVVFKEISVFVQKGDKIWAQEPLSRDYYLFQPNLSASFM